ncbi:hypothetical protein Tco_1127256 [Tanacetum coccineum]
MSNSYLIQPRDWQRFVTLVKQSQELKTVSYHKLYDILKQHQNEVNEIRTERLARTANPLALVAQQQPVYHHQNHPTQNTQYSSTRPQQSTRNRGKAIVTSSAPTYDPEPASDMSEEMSREKEIDKRHALISLSRDQSRKFSKINEEWVDNQRAVNVSGARENARTVRNPRVKAEFPKEKDVICGKKEAAGVQLNAEQVIWKDDMYDVTKDQNWNAHYLYMANSKSFVKPEFLKKAQRANPHLYDIGCYNDNLALMLAPDSDETIRLEKERRSKLSDLIRPFDYAQLNNLYDLFVPQREKFHLCLKEEMVADLKYVNSLEDEVDNLKSQMETQKTQLLNEIDRLSREYYYADHMNAILGIYTDLDEMD